MGAEKGSQNALQGNEKKSSVISMRIEPSRKELIRQAAAREGLPITQLVEMLIDDYAEKHL